jgi:sorting nexin-29
MRPLEGINYSRLLKKFNIPQKLIRLVKLTLKQVRCRVKVQSNLAVQSKTSVRLRQGDAASSLLFNLALKELIRN